MRAPQLSESRPQSDCSLAKSDAKHSLQPICITTPEQLSVQNFCFFGLRLCRRRVRISVCRVVKGLQKERVLKMNVDLQTLDRFVNRSLIVKPKFEMFVFWNDLGRLLCVALPKHENRKPPKERIVSPERPKCCRFQS